MCSKLRINERPGIMCTFIISSMHMHKTNSPDSASTWGYCDDALFFRWLRVGNSKKRRVKNWGFLKCVALSSPAHQHAIKKRAQRSRPQITRAMHDVLCERFLMRTTNNDERPSENAAFFPTEISNESNASARHYRLGWSRLRCDFSTTITCLNINCLINTFYAL